MSVEPQLLMITLSLPWYWHLQLAVGTVGFLVITGFFVVQWIRHPSWMRAVLVLWGLALLTLPAWAILKLLGIMMPQPPPIPTPWLLIASGVVFVVIGSISLLMDGDGPNARRGCNQTLAKVGFIAWGVAFVWVGLAGLNAQEPDSGAAEHKAAQNAYEKGSDFFSAAAKFEEVVGLFVSTLFLIGAIFLTVSELRKPSEVRERNVFRWVITTLIIGAVILVNWWLRF
jgi:hypothetical protein